MTYWRIPPYERAQNRTHPGERPGIYISNTDARILLHGRMGELKRIVRQCFSPDNPSAPVQRALLGPVIRAGATDPDGPPIPGKIEPLLELAPIEE